MQVIILGPPGVGKGTQAELIAKKLSLVHFSTGEILRKAVDEKTPLGLKAKDIMEKGQLVSDDVVIGIIREELEKVGMNQGFILDGFPRTFEQAKALDILFEEMHFNDIKIVNLIADENELIKRLMKRGRQDDTYETVKRRLAVYREQTAPVKAYYDKIHTVYDINGIGDIEEINSRIIEVLTKIEEKQSG